MRAVLSFFKELLTGSWSLVGGLSVTLREFFKPNLCVRYPFESLAMTERYRGPIELIRNPESGHPRCTVCLMCQKACPSNCIAIEGARFEGVKTRVPTDFKFDFTTCSQCGLCVESCKFDALRFSHLSNLAGYTSADYRFELVDFMHKQAGTVKPPKPVEPPKPPPAAPAAPAAGAGPPPGGAPS